MMADNIIPLEVWKARIQKGRNGAKKSLTNLMLHLRNVAGLGKSIRLNEFTGRIEWRGRPLQDTDIAEMRLILEGAGYEPAVSDVGPAVDAYAKENAYDPVKDWLDSLKWDNVPRVDTWVQDYMGALDIPVLRAFGSKFLIGAVARVYHPGCQMDNMLVLEGEQGVGKTTAVSALFGRDYMISSISEFKSKEAAIALQGRWVVEVAELAALNRTDVRDVKKFITETIDQYRPVHGKQTIDRPRRCVFIGTTNEHQYLKDSTGNRRFWSVPCGIIDIPGITAARDQIWAEAVARYREGEYWHITDPETLKMATLVQADRTEEDVWGPVIDDWLASDSQINVKYFLSGDILYHALGMTRDRQSKADQMRVADHLDKRRWSSKKITISKGSKQRWYWVRP